MVLVLKTIAVWTGKHPLKIKLRANRFLMSAQRSASAAARSAVRCLPLLGLIPFLGAL